MAADDATRESLEPALEAAAEATDASAPAWRLASLYEARGDCAAQRRVLERLARREPAAAENAIAAIAGCAVA